MDQAPIWSDVSTFDARPWRDVVDIVTGGYPCQPFSHAGKRLGEADPRHLWPHFARIISECQPQLVFCENVAAHLRNGFPTVARDLQEMGYKVAATLHTASEHGAWHKRERLFWLATRHTDSGSEHAIPVDAEVAGESGGSAMAHSESVRHPKGRLPSGAQAQQSGPTDDGQRNFKYLGWEAEPAVGRVADGVANRVDQLRACGNGVVPQVAAAALMELAAALRELVNV